MIPQFDYNGVLPPYVNGSPVPHLNQSPYVATMSEVVVRFGTSPARRSILRGLFRYRAWLTETMGIRQATQWLDGSFVENCEILRFRAPGDIDVMTFYERPDHLKNADVWEAFCEEHADHFDSQYLKGRYHCDGYSHDLSQSGAWTVKVTRYWHGLFSHQRGSRLWKGMVEVALPCDDAAALQLLDLMDADGLEP